MKTFDTAPAPHRAPTRSVQHVMLLVCAALVPGTLVQTVLLGPGVLVQVLLAVGAALVVETAMLRLRGQPVARFMTDGSAVLTAWLFALCVPPLAPWWIAVVGMIAAIGLAKHAFGGLGHNLFNPAMVGYAVVLLCWPLALTRWTPPGTVDAQPGVLDTLRAIFVGAPDGSWDAVTGATPLTVHHELAARGMTRAEINNHSVFAASGGMVWSWIAAAFALGGSALCALRVVDWRTPVSVVAATCVLALPLWLLDADIHASPLQHLGTGGLMLAAFFIASDPVTGAGTPRGRWLFGAGFAAVVLVFRGWGAHADGIAFAILLMNAFAPLMDRYSAPRIFGR